MTIAFYTRYSRNGASSRMRTYQYIPFLESKGHTVKVLPLFNETYIVNLYQGKKQPFNILKGYVKRVLQVFLCFKYDVIVIEKELFPGIPAIVEGILHLFKKKYVVDFDDAIFHNYDLNSNKWTQLFLGNKINNVMKFSSFVTVCNAYLADKAYQAGAKKVVIIPTVIDIKRYMDKKHSDIRPLVIGWVGTPSTFKYVLEIKDIIQHLIGKHQVVFHFIGVTDSGDFDNGVQYITWSEETEVSSIQKFDIGIMPLNNNPWELGKCSYKLIQYMACAIPVIASPIGMNNEVVQQGKNGFLVQSIEDWVEAVIQLKDIEKRIVMGNYGRNVVEDKYSLQVQSKKLLYNLENL